MSSDSHLPGRDPIGERTFGRPPQVADFPPPIEQPPPAPSRRRREGLASTIMIISIVVIMIVAVAVIPVVAPILERQRGQDGPGTYPSGPSTPLDPGGPAEGGSGVGDPYFPNYGSGGYDAQKYTVNVEWSPDDETLTGFTVIDARAEQRLRSFYVDLVLPVSKVTVNGEEATFRRDSFYDVRITPRKPVAANTGFRVAIDYGGNPAGYKINDKTPWWSTDGEVSAAGEPESSAWWYPANDHPADRAQLAVSARVPAGMEVISNGDLITRDRAAEDRFDTWQWGGDGLMNTYQSFISIGQYEVREGTADGRPYVYAVSEQLSRDQRDRAFKALQTTPAVIKELEEIYTSYPFDEIGGVVPAHQLWYAGLETATRPVYEAEAITADDPSDLIVHELAHAWFGAQISLEQWNDIFLNEAYASYTEWLVTERRGGRSSADQLQRSYERLGGSAGFWRVTMDDPGRDHLFDVVYLRGPMTLQALRNVIGDEAFAELTQSWVGRQGAYSLEDWMAAAQQVTTVDLDPFFDAWIEAETAPARTPQNGLA
jgi:aminopeptidase N